MPYDHQVHHRRSIRLKGHDYSQPGAYFVTIVTSQRECLFGKVVADDIQLNPFGQIAAEKLRFFSRLSWVKVEYWVVMPNHVHFIIETQDRWMTDEFMDIQNNLSRDTDENHLFHHGTIKDTVNAFVQNYKSVVSRKINGLRNASGMPVWQRNYYEHIIRNSNEYRMVADYIMDNPTQWNADPENQGISFK